MINATLCSTNTVEPWAANVYFEVNGTEWTVELSTKYSHYKNLLQNRNVVIVYKTADFEILAKGSAILSEPDIDEVATATISITWLRLVEKDNTIDYTACSEIEQVVLAHT